LSQTTVLALITPSFGYQFITPLLPTQISEEPHLKIQNMAVIYLGSCFIKHSHSHVSVYAQFICQKTFELI
ncbi:MAG: hypothetical protein FWC25_01430, partial [Dehalococcoidia bacterium]|nr:hypothetical protein [Dehalococcoidia bacterium]